jgi:putative endonuclease
MHYVYIVECCDGTLYTGYTTDIEKRIAKHNSGKGSKYTRARLPVTLLTFWAFDSKTSALREEYRIKRLNRVQKLKLIEARQQQTYDQPSQEHES